MSLTSDRSLTDGKRGMAEERKSWGNASPQAERSRDIPRAVEYVALKSDTIVQAFDRGAKSNNAYVP